MKFHYNHNGILIPDIVGTQCVNTLKVKDVEFPVRCGKCLPCKKRRRNEWSLRLEHEYLFSDSAYFITLTYDDLNVPYHYWQNKYKYKIHPITKKKIVVKRWKEIVRTDKPTLNRKDVQDYIKRIRNAQTKYYKGKAVIPKKIRYYLCAEYGDKTYRPHYHIILFNYDVDNIIELDNKWHKGYTQISELNSARINYTAKYMFKSFNIKDTREKPYALMSKKPIIGQAYLDNYGTYHINNENLETADQNGNLRRLPKAYIKRLFTNREDRIALSLKNYEEFQNKQEKQYKQKLEKYFNNDHYKFTKSIESDLQRRLKTINNKETL
jgi:hypothetical protein